MELDAGWMLKVLLFWGKFYGVVVKVEFRD